ncbi:MAG: PAS domain S-box protein [Methanomicrobiales archaeon]|nr:PAS domain S-box protein [Methanomicrobiales archaeon]
MLARPHSDTAWIVLIVLTSLATVGITVVSLSRGVYDVFPYLYLIPIVMVTFAFPHRGVLCSILLGGVYMALVYAFGLFNLALLTISTAWFYVFVSVGVVMSSLSEGMKREERRFRGIFENSQAGIFTIDLPSRTIAEANRQCSALLNYEPGELAGKDVAVIWPEVENGPFLTRVTSRYTVIDSEVCLKNRKGEIRWALMSLAPTADRQLVCSFVDITERKRIEQALLESEIKYRSIVERSLAGVYLIQDGLFRYVNPRFAEICGYRPEEMIDCIGLRDLVVPEDWPMVEATLEGRIAGELEAVRYECRCRTREQEIILLEVHGSRISYEGRTAVVGTALDITDRRQASDALRRANEKLNLLGSVTRHDLLNQLTAVQGYIGLAEETAREETVRKYLASAGGVTGKMETLLQFTRDYQNMGLREPEWQMVRDVALQAVPALDQGGIRVAIATDGLEVYADPLFEKVFYNLMDNTLRHGKRATEVRIYHQISADGLFLIYEDNGEGILDIEKELIFRRGYGRNTGFGLFLIREILALTGMTIRENGDHGKGARFEIFVPRGNYRFAPAARQSEGEIAPLERKA